MFRTRLIDRAVFRLIAAPDNDLEDRTDAATVYIGRGDQFDDDRRRVRALVCNGQAFRKAPSPKVEVLRSIREQN
jgi:hypothetical protein